MVLLKPSAPTLPMQGATVARGDSSRSCWGKKAMPQPFRRDGKRWDQHFLGLPIFLVWLFDCFDDKCLNFGCLGAVDVTGTKKNKFVLGRWSVQLPGAAIFLMPCKDIVFFCDVQNALSPNVSTSNIIFKNITKNKLNTGICISKKNKTHCSNMFRYVQIC